MLTHEHRSDECGIAFAAWSGFDSPLRRRATLASCVAGGHRLWWTLEAATPAEALAQLPPYLAERTDVSEVRETRIP